MRFGQQFINFVDTRAATLGRTFYPTITVQQAIPQWVVQG
jgi:hypothetical protein